MEGCAPSRPILGTTQRSSLQLRCSVSWSKNFVRGGSVAQSVEQRPFKALVPGSSPGRPIALITLASPLSPGNFVDFSTLTQRARKRISAKRTAIYLSTSGNTRRVRARAIVVTKPNRSTVPSAWLYGSGECSYSRVGNREKTTSCNRHESTSHLNTLDKRSLMR